MGDGDGAAICDACGQVSPAGAAFCLRCGGPLAPEPSGRRRDARKVVSVLFCDLVGSTAAGELLDPEEVSAVLRRYHRVVRTLVEQHGGVLEKFVGDGAFAVFGVPTLHEDDAERAVRTALAICDAAERLPGLGEPSLRLRCGVTTGETLVHLGVEHGSGEGFITGSAANLAGRIQGLAPVNGVLVDETTFRRTEHVIEYAPVDPVTVKGRDDPMRVLLALAPVLDVPAGGRQRLAPAFVGRQDELAVLMSAFDEVVAEGRAVLLTISGEPGLGKSRLVAALRERLSARGTDVVWRVGRCLPYSDGVGLWAFTEILKSHAGVLETDDAATTRSKLDGVLPDDAEHDWLRQRLLPLLGVSTGAAADRDELYAACRRFIELVALEGPAVVVFEDVHWADGSLLAGLAELARNPPRVPLLVLVTTRPELLETGGAAASEIGSRALHLAPLPDEHTAQIVAGLLAGAAVSADLEQEILRSAEGNALFAGEYVRLLLDSGTLVSDGGVWQLAAGQMLPVPASIQALIAARLDVLPELESQVLADASVVGGTFWPGAVTAVSGSDAAAVGRVLDRLEARNLVRSAQSSSLGGERELRFTHALVREAAYAQLTREDRASKHRDLARWIERSTGDREGDVVDILAHHWILALALLPSGEDDEEARAAALRWSVLAARRNLALDVGAASAHLDRALALCTPDDPAAVDLLPIAGLIAQQDGRMEDATDLLEQAVAAYRAAGDPRAAVRTMMQLAFVYQHRGDSRAFQLAGEAVAMLEDLPPCPELVEALAMQAGARALGGDPAAGNVTAERALEVARALGMDRPPVALGFRGMSRFYLGDPRGADDVREAAELAQSRGEGRDAAVWMHNHAQFEQVTRGALASTEDFQRAARFSSQRGLQEMASFARMASLDALLDLGRIDDVLTEASVLEAEAERNGSDYVLLYTRAVLLRTWVHLDRPARLDEVARQVEPASRLTGVPEDLAAGLTSCLVAYAALGRQHEVRRLAEDLLGSAAASTWIVAPRLAAVARALVASDHADLLEPLMTATTHPSPYARAALASATALVDEREGRWSAAERGHRDAARGYDELDVPVEHWLALLAAARCCDHLGDGERARRAREEAAATRDSMPGGSLLVAPRTSPDQSVV